MVETDGSADARSATAGADAPRPRVVTWLTPWWRRRKTRWISRPPRMLTTSPPYPRSDHVGYTDIGRASARYSTRSWEATCNVSTRFLRRRVGLPCALGYSASRYPSLRSSARPAHPRHAGGDARQPV